MELKKKDDGYWHVGYQTDHGYKWKNTHATTRPEAEEIVAQAKIAELESAAKAMTLSQEVLSSIMAGRRVTCAKLLKEWIEWRQLNKAPATAQSQAWIVCDFMKKLGVLNQLVSRVDSEMIDSFVNATDAGSASNRHCRINAIRSFFRFAQSKAYVAGDPSRIVQVNYRILSHEQKEPMVRVPFTHAEYVRIVGNTTGFIRWSTALSYWTGLRLSDCANLEWSQLKASEVVVWTRKRNARVALPISDPLIGGGELAMIILEIMESVPKAGKTAQFIFPEERAVSNNPVIKSKLSTYFVRRIRELGIETKTFHCLRHSFASRLKKAGKTEEEIGRLIGHADVETTQGYIHA